MWKLYTKEEQDKNLSTLITAYKEQKNTNQSLEVITSKYGLRKSYFSTFIRLMDDPRLWVKMKDAEKCYDIDMMRSLDIAKKYDFPVYLLDDYLTMRNKCGKQRLNKVFRDGDLSFVVTRKRIPLSQNKTKNIENANRFYEKYGNVFTMSEVSNLFGFGNTYLCKWRLDRGYNNPHRSVVNPYLTKFAQDLYNYYDYRGKTITVSELSIIFEVSEAYVNRVIEIQTNRDLAFDSFDTEVKSSTEPKEAASHPVDSPKPSPDKMSMALGIIKKAAEDVLNLFKEI